MYVVDSGDFKVYAYTLDGGARDSGRDIALDSSDNRGAWGAWSDRTTIWVADTCPTGNCTPTPCRTPGTPP